MTSFYVSPSALTMKQYQYIVKYCIVFGWKAKFVWPKDIFRPDAVLKNKVLKKAAMAIAASDIFIGYVPGTLSTCFEIGLAYSKCAEVVLIAKDPVYYKQTGMADAYIASLPNIKRLSGDPAAIPTLLQVEYNHLICYEQLEHNLARQIS